MATNPKTSPKVISAGVWAGVIAVLIAMLAAITPDMLDFAGRFTPVIYAGVVGLASVLGAYLKRDPDRELPDPPIMDIDEGPLH